MSAGKSNCVWTVDTIKKGEIRKEEGVGFLVGPAPLHPPDSSLVPAPNLSVGPRTNGILHKVAKLWFRFIRVRRRLNPAASYQQNDVHVDTKQERGPSFAFLRFGLLLFCGIEVGSLFARQEPLYKRIIPKSFRNETKCAFYFLNKPWKSVGSISSETYKGGVLRPPIDSWQN